MFSAKIFKCDWSTYMPSVIVIELMYEKIRGGGGGGGKFGGK